VNILQAIDTPTCSVLRSKPENMAGLVCIPGSVVRPAADPGPGTHLPGLHATERARRSGKRSMVGRRSSCGKSFVLALIAVFLASFRDWRPFLGPGEKGNHLHYRC
jgi:hypothetical protein